LSFYGMVGMYLNVTIIVLTNMDNENPYQITNALADMVFAGNGG
jgi:hypothetical protein